MVEANREQSNSGAVAAPTGGVHWTPERSAGA